MSKRLRVLSLIGDLSFGGGEYRLLALARNIDRTRVDHTVLTLYKADPNVPETVDMRKHYEAAGIRLRDLGESRGHGLRGSWRKCTLLFRCIYNVIKVIRELDVDVVDAHLEVGSVVGSVAAMITRRKCVTTFYTKHPLDESRLW